MYSGKCSKFSWAVALISKVYLWKLMNQMNPFPMSWWYRACYKLFSCLVLCSSPTFTLPAYFIADFPRCVLLFSINRFTIVLHISVQSYIAFKGETPQWWALFSVIQLSISMLLVSTWTDWLFVLLCHLTLHSPAVQRLQEADTRSNLLFAFKKDI